MLLLIACCIGAGARHLDLISQAAEHVQTEASRQDVYATGSCHLKLDSLPCVGASTHNVVNC